MTKKKRRGSSLDRFFACPSSTVKPKAPHDPRSEIAAFGIYVHAGIAGVKAPADGVDLDEADAMIERGREIAEEAISENSEATVLWEHPVRSDRITGTLDFAIVFDNGSATIYDWKTGYKTAGHREQITGYADGLVNEYPQIKVVRCGIQYLRTGETDAFEVGADDLALWRDAYDAQARQEGKRYAAGEHCTYCPRALECNTLREYRRSSVESLSALGGKEITPEKIAEAYDLAEATRAALNQWDKFVKDTLRGGPIALSGGRVLTMGSSSRAAVDVKKAWPILKKNGFSDNEINEALSMSLPKLKKINKEIEAVLAEAGAVSRTYFDRKVVRKEQK